MQKFRNRLSVQISAQTQDRTSRLYLTWQWHKHVKKQQFHSEGTYLNTLVCMEDIEHH